MSDAAATFAASNQTAAAAAARPLAPRSTSSSADNCSSEPCTPSHDRLIRTPPSSGRSEPLGASSLPPVHLSAPLAALFLRHAHTRSAWRRNAAGTAELSALPEREKLGGVCSQGASLRAVRSADRGRESDRAARQLTKPSTATAVNWSRSAHRHVCPQCCASQVTCRRRVRRTR